MARSVNQNSSRPDVVPENDPFLKPAERKGCEYTNDTLTAFGLGLMCVSAGSEFSEPGQEPSRCSDMPGAVLHGLSERMHRREFSFDDPTATCERFLDDVIKFAKHLLSKKRLRNTEVVLHPVDPDLVEAVLAQVWYLERLAVTIFASVAPGPYHPDQREVEAGVAQPARPVLVRLLLDGTEVRYELEILQNGFLYLRRRYTR